MKIFKKNELRDIIIAFCAFGAVLALTAMLKDKQTTKNPHPQKNSIHLTFVQQQAKVLE